MATVYNGRLTINLIGGTSDTDVIATVDVAFTTFETFLLSGPGLRFFLKCQLRGQDGTLFNGGDDDLFFFPDQTVSAPGTFTFRSTVNRSTLDEDNGDDEVYAEFTLQSKEAVFPFSQSTSSPIITGNF